ncbi:MAG: 50S ribosomal protein L18 [Armatimonadetes bacterium]|nr:50S ribosomal protein L18 [Armatimonadota bacterium]
MGKKTRDRMRQIRHKRIRAKVRGTAERPRLCVYRSLRHISAQVIDDDRSETIVAASSQEKGISNGGNCEGATAVGALVGKRAMEKGIKRVVFDRAGHRYAGRVAGLGKAAREVGLEF